MKRLRAHRPRQLKRESARQSRQRNACALDAATHGKGGRAVFMQRRRRVPCSRCLPLPHKSQVAKKHSPSWQLELDNAEALNSCEEGQGRAGPCGSCRLPMKTQDSAPLTRTAPETYASLALPCELLIAGEPHRRKAIDGPKTACTYFQPVLQTHLGCRSLPAK